MSCLEYSLKSSFVCRNEEPPPIPPHINRSSANIDYKPPVPPHRNIGVTANVAVGNVNMLYLILL